VELDVLEIEVEVEVVVPPPVPKFQPETLDSLILEFEVVSALKVAPPVAVLS